MGGKRLDEVKQLSYDVMVVTYNHREGLNCAEAIAVHIYGTNMKKGLREELLECCNHINTDLDYGHFELIGSVCSKYCL